MSFITRACLSTLFAISALAGPGMPLPRATAQTTSPQEQHEGVMTPAVMAAMRSLAAGEMIGVIVRMQDVSDTKPLPPTEGMSVAQTRAAMMTSLQMQASASQAAVMAWLQQPATASQIEGLRTYWIINGFAMRATADVIGALALRPDVESVRLDGWVQATQDDAPQPTDLDSLPEPVRRRVALNEDSPPYPFYDEMLTEPQSAEALQAGETTWGVRKIRADQAWRSLNVTGEGVVVANIDSGVDWQHPALQPRYRGFAGGPVADHLHNWYDATNEGAIYPSDAYGHGTHVMGIMVGQNGVGVAPGARWMAIKGLNSDGSGQYSWLHSAFQFALAPGGDPAYAPDILNNSWGATNGADLEFKDDLGVLRAAGIFVVFANGNRGPLTGSVSSPASYPSVIGAGASDADDDLAYFSSRGPSSLTKEPKPTLVAPGVGVTSTFPGGGYKAMNGTSMAAPHVAGAAALMLSANPSLDITQTLFVLTSTAVAMSDTVPNSLFGWGRIDAYSATLAVMTSGVVSGVVSNGGQPIANATVIAENAPYGLRAETVADANGRYVLRMAPGAYMISAGAYGHFTSTIGPRIINAGELLQQDFDLQAQPSGIVRGAVRDALTGASITATVLARDTPRSSHSNIDCPNCRYEIALPAGTHVIEARVAGYKVQTQTVQVADGATTEINFMLSPAQRIAFVDSGAAFYGSAAEAFHASFDQLQLGYDEFRIKKIPGDTPTLTQLLTYDAVVWSAPYDAPSFVGGSPVLSAYLAAGKNLLLTGQNIALYDGGGALSYSPYFLNQVNAVYTAKNRGATQFIGAAGGPLAGMVVPFTETTSFFAPDVVQVLRPNDAQLIGNYGDEINGNRGAGVWSDNCVKHRSAYFAFGLETLSLEDRSTVISRTLNAFTAPRPQFGASLASLDSQFTSALISQPGQTVTHVIQLRNTGDGGVTQTFTLEMAGNQWPAELSQASVTLAPCASAKITVTVSIPPNAGRNEHDILNVTARANAAPEVRALLAVESKTPAGILLVDDDRFINREGDYMDALAAYGNTFDVWSTRWGISITNSPPITFMKQYPLVIWQNGYDWFDPINAPEQVLLMKYLDGGGRLFFTSQAALAFMDLSPFTQQYLGVGDIDFDDVTSNVVGAGGTPLGDGPFGGTLLPFPYNWNLSSAVQPAPGTQVFLRGDSGQPFGVLREEPADASMHRPQWRTVFAPFAFEALETANMQELLNRIVGWLSPLGHSSMQADAATVAPGQRVNVTVTLRADDVITQWPGRLHAASVSVTLPAGFNLLSSSLPGAGSSNAGEWTGEINAGDAKTWVFSVIADGSADASMPLTMTAHYALEDLGIRFTQTKIVRVNAPALEPALEETQQSLWNGGLTLRVRVPNAGLSIAQNAVITVVVPSSVTLLAGSLIASLPGTVTTTTSTLVWQGDIPQGQVLTLDLKGSLPLLSAHALRSWMPATVMADDRKGGLTQATIALLPFTAHVYYPFMPKDAR